MRYIVNGQEVSREEWLEDSDRKLSEMFASCSPPEISTDATFLAGMYSKQAKRFNSKTGCAEELSAPLRAMGGSTTGKVYLSGIAKFIGDPQAWISDKHDIKRLCEERNLDCEGAVTHKADDRDAKSAEELRAKRPVHASEIVKRQVEAEVKRELRGRKRKK